MEAVFEQNRAEVIRPKNLEEIRARVDAYLRAWRLPENVREEIVATVMEHAEQRGDGDVMSSVIEEAEKTARAKFEETELIPPLVPQRLPETYPMTMETSLSRLPSFRMIAGWFVIIALIVLAFIFTR